VFLGGQGEQSVSGRGSGQVLLVSGGCSKSFFFSRACGLLAAPGCGAALSSCRVPIPFLIPGVRSRRSLP
jgi:hypothetical protein